MNDPMVRETQEWLNATYVGRPGFDRMTVTGKTGWPTIYALTHALQIELGIQVTSNNFGPGTASAFRARYPNGVKQQAPEDSTTSNVYSIIQGALWCKSYATGANITQNFYSGTGKAIRDLKSDMGLTDQSPTVDLEIMEALLSMNQFVLLASYGGRYEIRTVQQEINQTYRNYTGIVPTDGLFGREMNMALIKVLQSIQGYTPTQATGNFGDGTRSRLKTIKQSNAASNPEWLWLATVALICNGYGVRAVRVWDPSIGPTLGEFQKNHALPVTNVIDPTTWMSLLTSKGDPDRPAIACDTRFEITDSLLARLKSDGYQIVGRYLTEANQDNKDPANYFKAVRPGELERITTGDMKFFPIYQEYSTELRHFSRENAARHASEARKRATYLGIPSTYIYFAVDFDATDAQVTSHILPYFQTVKANLGGGYRVGIYGARNVCSRVIDAGYAGSAFVSDMSTGFSGNLGYPIPKAWNYDQFHEIKNYGGEWDLDKVAYSPCDYTPVDYVTTPYAGEEQVNTSTNYQLLSPIDLIWHLENRFEQLRGIDKFGEIPLADEEGNYEQISTARGILNYLSKDYLRGGSVKLDVMFSFAAEEYRGRDAEILEGDEIAGAITSALDRYIGKRRQNMIDVSLGEVDLAHLAVTTIGYGRGFPIPAIWTGWAGDIATGSREIQRVANLNQGVVDAQRLVRVADALTGQDDDYRQHPGLAGLTLSGAGELVSNTCNFSDLCSDGDAIVLARKLSVGDHSRTHLLSETMRVYYNNRDELKKRFKEIAWSVGANDEAQASDIFRSFAVGSIDELFYWALVQSVAEPYKFAACDALARFIF